MKLTDEEELSYGPVLFTFMNIFTFPTGKVLEWGKNSISGY